MKQTKILFAIGLLLALLVVNTACSDGADASDGPVTGVKVGNFAPNFVLKDLNGEVVDLKALRGKVVLVDFWDTWCGPCKVAMPHLQELHLETKEKDVVVLAVALGRGGEKVVSSFIEKHGYTFTTVIGDRTVFDAYKVSGIPATFIIGPDGVIDSSWVGAKSKKEYEDAVHAAGSKL